MPNSMLLISALMMLDTLACAWIGWRGKRFLKTTPALETDEDLERYRQLIHRCMYASLVFLILFIASAVTAAVLLFVDLVRPTDLGPVLFTGMVRLVVASFISLTVEGQLKTIPVSTPELAFERDALVRMWDSRPLPTAVPRDQDFGP